MKTLRAFFPAAVLLGLSFHAAAQPPPKDAPLPRDEVTRIVAQTRKIVSPNGIEELVPVQINGATQWLSIRGRDRRNPILLFLHGGPGSPTLPVAYTFQSPWEDYFTVVQWDQRGTGKTYAANDPKALDPTMNLAQMNSDAEQVVAYLRQQYGKKKIFLLGHSWGSVLGVMLAQQHPDWFYAYLGVGQVVNVRAEEVIGYRFALDQAHAADNATAVKELEAIAPYPGEGPIALDKISTERKWVTYFGGLTYGRTDFNYDVDARLLSPDYTPADLQGASAGSLYSVQHLMAAASSVDFDEVTDFKCPVFLFEGRHDYTVPFELAASWFQQLHAPLKELVWFDDSAHMIMQEQPGRFLMHLVSDLRPLAAAAGDVAPAEQVEH
jgi:pimeloyl-ACP methyl ester carboxylesterase